MGSVVRFVDLRFFTESCDCDSLTLVDVVVPVSLEPRGVEQDAGVWAESTQVVSVLGLDHQRPPSTTILGALVLKTLTNLIQAIGLHPRNVVRFSSLILQSQRDRKRRNKIYIADIDKQLPAVESELAEREIGIGIGVSWVEDRGLDESRAGVDEELQALAGGEPDAATGDARDSRNDGVAGGAEVDGDVLGQVLAGRGWGGRVVRGFGICGEDEQFAAVVDGLAGWFGLVKSSFLVGWIMLTDVGVDFIRGCLVLKSDLQSGHSARNSDGR